MLSAVLSLIINVMVTVRVHKHFEDYRMRNRMCTSFTHEITAFNDQSNKQTEWLPLLYKHIRFLSKPFSEKETVENVELKTNKSSQ